VSIWFQWCSTPGSWHRPKGHARQHGFRACGADGRHEDSRCGIAVWPQPDPCSWVWLLWCFSLQVAIDFYSLVSCLRESGRRISFFFLRCALTHFTARTYRHSIGDVPDLLTSKRSFGASDERSRFIECDKRSVWPIPCRAPGPALRHRRQAVRVVARLSCPRERSKNIYNQCAPRRPDLSKVVYQIGLDGRQLAPQIAALLFGPLFILLRDPAGISDEHLSDILVMVDHRGRTL
jgi:hypothetical protein